MAKASKKIEVKTKVWVVQEYYYFVYGDMSSATAHLFSTRDKANEFYMGECDGRHERTPPEEVEVQ